MSEPLDLNAAAVLLERAVTWHQRGEVARAESAYRQVLDADPSSADAMALLGTIHHERGDRELALRLLRAAIALRPDQGRYYHNLALVLAARGDRPGNVAALRTQCMLNPQDPEAWAALIFAMDLHPHSVPSIRLADRRDFNRHCCAALTLQATPHTNDRDPDRPLRVGYLSADCKAHSAMMVCEPVLNNHTLTQVIPIVYSSLVTKDQPIDATEAPVEPGVERPYDDQVTRRIKRAVAGWRDVGGLSDAQLAQQIRADQIDIAVDLSGFSAGNRLVALAHQPAPVQMTAWGHITGVGMDAVRYLLACPTSVPDEHRSHYREEVLHLPCVVPYRLPDPLPQLTPPPIESNGYITFGYLGRSAKASEGVWSAWVDILHRVPHSRLILKSADYSDADYRARISDYFISLKISAHRLEFRPSSDHDRHLATYNECDVILDAFPQGGGVTTLEASVMGVRSVALAGNYLNARVAPAILKAIGAGQYVAESTTAYVQLAVLAAMTPWRLADRVWLRNQLLRSDLVDGAAYTAAVEALYRQAWHAWLAPATVEATPITVGASTFTRAPSVLAGGNRG